MIVQFKERKNFTKIVRQNTKLQHSFEAFIKNNVSCALILNENATNLLIIIIQNNGITKSELQDAQKRNLIEKRNLKHWRIKCLFNFKQRIFTFMLEIPNYKEFLTVITKCKIKISTNL